MNRKTAAAAALAVLSVAALTACQSDAGASASGTSSPAGSVSAAPAAPSAPSASPSSGTSGGTTGGTTGGSGATGGSGSTTTGSTTTGGTTNGSAVDASVATCKITDLNVLPAHEATIRPDGTGTGAVVVGFTNVSAHTCTVHGFPTVAGAGMGAPDHNRPLTITHVGSTATIKLHPGGRAWVKLTFVQTQGEADGYCVSGATPSTYPSMVVGLPGVGRYQTTTDDGGVLAECDDTAAVTAVSLVRPA